MALLRSRTCLQYPFDSAGTRVLGMQQSPHMLDRLQLHARMAVGIQSCPRLTVMPLCVMFAETATAMAAAAVAQHGC